jgi:[methyl-Co(III) methanol-specific corrinoid protein]:coenzyme M methyltransferase
MMPGNALKKGWSYKERFLRALRREPIDRVPVPAFCSHPLIGLMGRAGVTPSGIHDRLNEMVSFSLSAMEVLGFEGVRLPTDGVVEAEALGCRVTPGEAGKNPSVVDHPYSLEKRESRGDFLQKGRIPLVLEAVRMVRTKVADDVPVTSHFMGPATLASHLLGSDRFFMGLIDQPEETKRFLLFVSRHCIEIANALGRSGADVLQMPDPMASSDVISPTMFEAFVLPCYREIFTSVACPVALHICGNSKSILPHLKGSGAIGFSFDAKVPVSEVRKVLGGEIALVGNISTTETLLTGTRQEVRNEALRAIRDGIHVLAPSCGFAPATPLENVKEMISAAKQGAKG